ncbi:MAG: hypothetical protein A2806_03255 [Candidatus Terrybacteria bacterium RIFCSPHIGHO2_01_FULL_48_17]|uniref:AtpZ/AtpI family protein n=1 Tax=Candidatus Terrybacteria bacterium RIFCSPHIGHO2_01_FULL_48_17 TaxID=1802362 RepID=A0A1G2PIZ6_9BACT|nr:MAG: hypothetical protein A2806_03255 [Candidatus Terrybacteria bacterium RIFCSPHIGHO2_01_FULL_48_17]OHA53152.1 MAG: hypothetical protein A3A30_02205 [Candidatus Terrybacteria bacterium RIFCSPLOWO2_01_FULL_48_14]
MLQEKENGKNMFPALRFAWEFGYSVAIPIVVLLFGGRALDRVLGTSPWLLLVGLFFSLIVTGVIIWYKVRKFL